MSYCSSVSSYDYTPSAPPIEEWDFDSSSAPLTPSLVAGKYVNVAVTYDNTPSHGTAQKGSLSAEAGRNIVVVECGPYPIILKNPSLKDIGGSDHSDRCSDSFDQRYTKERGISDASGAFAAVSFIRRNEDQELCVLKRPGGTCSQEDSEASIVRESQILEGLSHKYIVQKIEDLEVAGMPCIVLSRGGEELFTYLMKGNGLDINTSMEITRQGLLALEYLRNNRITHADLKPENILFDGKKIMLIDFGLAFKGRQAFSFPRGTAAYTSPEMLLGQEVGPDADLWSLGIVAMTCYTCRMLFSVTHRDLTVLPAIHEEVFEREYPESCQSLQRYQKAKRKREGGDESFPTFKMWMARTKSLNRDDQHKFEKFQAGLDKLLAFDPTQRPTSFDSCFNEI